MECSSLKSATYNEHWNIVRWLIENRCPMYDNFFNLCKKAAERDMWDIVELALNRGCHCPDYNIRIFLQKIKSKK
jgi:hypothetical protein